MACIRRMVRPLVYYILMLYGDFLTPCSCMILRPSSRYSKAHGTISRWKGCSSPVTRQSSPSARVPPAGLLMTHGFGPSKPDRKAATTGEALARAMQDKYEQLRRDGGTVAQVHTRIKGTERWYVVGYVCTEEGKMAEGIQGQKRLLLDHAAKMYTELNSKKLVLETGYSLEGESEEVVPCKAKYSGEKVGVALDPLPDGPVVRKMLEGGVDMKLRAAKASAAESRIKYT